MPSRALTIAIASGVLLVAVVAADVAMNRKYHLEAFLDGRWIIVGTYPYDIAYGRGIPSMVAFDVNASDEIPMRLRIDNGYPIAFSETFEVTTFGEQLAAGTLTAAGRGTGSAEFTVVASRLFSAGGERIPTDKADGVSAVWHPYFSVRVGGEYFEGSLALREVGR